MPKVLIADDVVEECPRTLREGGVEVDNKGKMKPDEVKAIIGGYEGLVVRSAIKVTKEIIDAGSRLKIIGRAGIGVDNIDVDAASRRGVIVMNAPLGNVTSAAEHAMALMLASARNVARADAQVRSGKWERNKNVGVELEGKTLGIVGLGKIGAHVMRAAKALGMRVLGFDPLLVKERAEVLGVELVEWDRLLKESDFITLHVPMTEKTRHMIGAAQLKMMKRSARIINASRGGIIDEKALADALAAKTIAGAALDVFEVEPLAADSPLLKLDSVVLTPHLGASTEEAQVKVAVDIAHQFVAYFRTGLVRNAVNLNVADPSLSPYLKLSESLGAMAFQLAGGKPRDIEVTCAGAIGSFDTAAITGAAICGMLAGIVGSEVNIVNARIYARETGLVVTENRRKDAGNYKSLLTVRVGTDEGNRSIAGTIFEGGQARIVAIDDFDIDIRPSRHMLMMLYPDVPGMVGKFGTVLGGGGINIARMEVGRDARGKQAIVLVAVDDPVPPKLIEEIRARIELKDIKGILLPAE